MVQNWAVETFGVDGEKFIAEEVTGETLISERITSLDAMERLGIKTLGKQERFKKAVQTLKGKIYFIFCTYCICQWLLL